MVLFDFTRRNVNSRPMRQAGTDTRPALISKRRPWVEIGLLALLATLGIALRLRQYLFNRPLWQDEIALARNVIDRDLFTLLSMPLAFKQSVPPGFLIPTRLTVLALGPDEWVLRLTPLVAGVLAVLVAAVLARRELRSTAARVTFVGLVALSPVLIYHSSEFKQYSSDALVALCILLAISYRNSRYGTWLLAAAGFVGILCSLPAVFVAVPAAVLICYETYRSAQWRQAISVAIAWGAGAALHGLYHLQAGMDRERMVQGWGGAGTFAPFPPASISELLWYPRSLLGLIFLAFRQVVHVSARIQASWFDGLNCLLALIFLLALGAVMASRHRIGLVAAGAFLATLIAAALEALPFLQSLADLSGAGDILHHCCGER